MKKGGCITVITFTSDTAVPEMRAFGWPDFFFLANNIKIHSFTSLTGGGGLQGNFGRYRCAAEIAKTPQS